MTIRLVDVVHQYYPTGGRCPPVAGGHRPPAPYNIPGWWTLPTSAYNRTTGGHRPPTFGGHRPPAILAQLAYGHSPLELYTPLDLVPFMIRIATFQFYLSLRYHRPGFLIAPVLNCPGGNPFLWVSLRTPLRVYKLPAFHINSS